MARSPAYDEHPEHRITLENDGRRMRARFGDQTLAESSAAVVVREGRYPPVVYFPHADVAWSQLEATAHHTHCPFKGDASYWSIQGAGERGENAAWSYRAPFDQVAALCGMVAFYTDRVEVEPAA